MNKLKEGDTLYVYSLTNYNIRSVEMKKIRYYSEDGCYFNVDAFTTYYDSFFKLYYVYDRKDQLVGIAHTDRVSLKQNIKKWFVHKAELYIELLRDIDNE